MDEKQQITDYLGFEVDAEDWKNIKEMIEQIRTDKIKYDILYWSDKRNRGYIVRTNKTK